MKIKLLLLAFVVIAFCSCTNRIGDFTIASSKNMDIRTHTYKVESNVRVEGDDTKHIIIFFPTGLPNLKEAMDNAIEKAPGAVGLSDVTLKYGEWYIPIFYGQIYYIVEGSPIYENNKN